MSGEQANGLVPYLRATHHGYLLLRLYHTILPHMQESGNIPSTPAPDKQWHSHPNPLQGDGTSRVRAVILESHQWGGRRIRLILKESQLTNDFWYNI